MKDKIRNFTKNNAGWYFFLPLLICWIIIVLYSYSQNNEKLHVSIDTFTLKGKYSISFGSQGDFHLNGIEKPFSLVFKDTSAYINLNRNQYIKINNENVNLYSLEENYVFLGDSLITKNALKTAIRSNFEYKNLGFIYNNQNIKSIAFSEDPEDSGFDFQIIALDTLLKKANDEPYFKFSKPLENKNNKYKIEAFNLYRAETILKNESISKSFMSPVPIKNNFGNEVYVLERLVDGIKIHFTKQNYQIIDYRIIDSLDKSDSETKKVFLNFSDNQLIDNAIYFPHFAKALNNQSMYLAFEDFSNIRLVSGRTEKGEEKADAFTSSLSHFFQLNAKTIVNNDIYKMELSISKNPIYVTYFFIVLLILLNFFFLLSFNKVKILKYWLVYLLLSIKLIVAYNLAFNSPYFYNLFLSTIIVVPVINLLYLFYVWKFNRLNIKNKIVFRVAIVFGGFLIALSFLKTYHFAQYYNNLSLINWKLNIGFNPIKDFLKSIEEYYLHIPLIVLITSIILVTISLISFIKLKKSARKKMFLFVFYISICLVSLIAGNAYEFLLLPVIIITIAVVVKKHRLLDVINKISTKTFIKYIVINVLLSYTVYLLFSYLPELHAQILSGFLLIIYILFILKKFNILKYGLIYIPFLFIIGVTVSQDFGLVIVLLGILIFTLIFITLNSKKYWNTVLLAVAIVFLVIAPRLLPEAFTTSSREYSADRSSRRFNALIDFEANRDKGYRVTEEDNEYFVLMGKYAAKGLKRPNLKIDNELPFFHKDISELSNPTVVNDLSTLTTLIRPFGFWSLLFLAFLWLFLITSVFKEITSNDTDSKDYTHISFKALLRVLALGAFVFQGLYLILSYYSVYPFTGRVIFGLGVDSVGEHLAFIVLMVFITLDDRTNEAF